MATGTRAPHEAEITKWTAEADQARATATEKEAAAEKELALARKARLETDALALEFEKAQESRRKALAGDEYHKVYRFNSQVGADSVKACMTRLAEWSRNDPGCEIEIVFCSPGGSVIDGMQLFDYILDLRRMGHKVTTKAMGYAASMAGILLQAGDLRVMASESWMLIHEASFGAMGSFGDVEDMVEWIRRVQDRILDIFATRAANSGAAKPITKAQLKRRWHRKDWWLSSDDALKLGLIDEVE